MSAQVIPFQTLPPRRINFTATPTQRDVLDQFMADLQVLMLEYPCVFRELARQAHDIAEPIRAILSQTS